MEDVNVFAVGTRIPPLPHRGPVLSPGSGRWGEGEPMRHIARRLDQRAFERLCEHMAVAIAHCSDRQVLDLADSLHAALRRRRRIVRGGSDRPSDPAEPRREGSFATLDT